jgi:hypothetical protein
MVQAVTLTEKETTMTQPTLNVRNIEQAACMLELDGQISDGHWENARPYDHWRVWTSAKVVVNPDNVGRNFYAEKSNYNLSDKTLLDIVGRRMLGIVRIARKFGIEVASTLEHAVSCDDGLLEDSKHTLAKLDLAGVSYEDVMKALADESYGMRQMRADLNDLKTIFKTRQAVA